MNRVLFEKKSSHPKEMYFLALIEMCQRFAFWGIGNLLVLYLVQFFRYDDSHADHVYGMYSGVAFILPLLGGFVADKTSHFKSVILGSVLSIMGCLFMALGSSHFMYVGLAFAACGAGLFTPSIYTILGRLYHEKHHLRDGGFSIYYAAVNIGVFFATISMGALGNAGHWTLAFVLASLIQFLGLILFLIIKKRPLFHEEHSLISIEKEKEPLKSKDRSRIKVIVVLSIVSIIFWMAYNQGWSSMSLFILKYTDRHIGNIEFSPSWILSSETLFLVLLAYPLANLYKWLAKHKKDPNPIVKTILSLFIMGACFFLLGIGAENIAPGATSAKVSPLYPIGAYFLMAVAEMLLAPIGLSLVTHLSPHRYTAFLVGCWYVCLGIAYYSGGILAGLMTSFSSLREFFDLFTLGCLGVGIVLVFFERKLNHMRHVD